MGFMACPDLLELKRLAVMRLSFLLNGEKMRQRLAQILSQAVETELDQEEDHEARRNESLSRAGTFE